MYYTHLAISPAQLEEVLTKFDIIMQERHNIILGIHYTQNTLSLRQEESCYRNPERNMILIGNR